jgi:hypothetical protein
VLAEKIFHSFPNSVWAVGLSFIFEVELGSSWFQEPIPAVPALSHIWILSNSGIRWNSQKFLPIPVLLNSGIPDRNRVIIRCIRYGRIILEVVILELRSALTLTLRCVVIDYSLKEVSNSGTEFSESGRAGIRRNSVQFRNFWNCFLIGIRWNSQEFLPETVTGHFFMPCLALLPCLVLLCPALIVTYQIFFVLPYRQGRPDRTGRPAGHVD